MMEIMAELWKTNGTEEGTVLVKDIWNGSNGGVQMVLQSLMESYSSPLMML